MLCFLTKVEKQEDGVGAFNGNFSASPEFLDSGHKCCTLDSGRWTLNAGL